MAGGVNMPLFVAGCVWPCLLVCAAMYGWPIAVSLFSGIAIGWWVRDLLGFLLRVPSAPAATMASGSESSGSDASGFLGEYWDPQARVHWVIKDAHHVIAGCKKNGRTMKTISGWFEGSKLTLEFSSEKKFDAQIQGPEPVWSNKAPSWIKQ